MVSTSTLPITTAQPEFGYGQLFQILLRRWPWILGSLSLGIAGALYVNAQQKPAYQSSMQLLVQPNFEEDWRLSDFSESAQAPRLNEADYATQLSLLRSNQFLVEASEQLRETYPDLTPNAIKQGFALERIGEGRAATRIFQATYVSDDPVKTKRVLETLQQLYSDYNLQQRQDRLNQGLEHVDQQLAETQENLRTAQTSLEQFRRQENLIDPTSQGQVILAALNGVQAEQQQLNLELAELETRYQNVGQQLRLSPQAALTASRLSQASRVQTLLAEMQATSLAAANRQILFTDQDASVQVLIAEQQNQLDHLMREISAIVRQPVSELTPDLLSSAQLAGVDLQLVSQLVELDTTLVALEARGNSLIALESSLRQDLERFPGLIAEYDRLQPGVDIARDSLQRLLQQREQVTSELARGGFTWQIVESPQEGFAIPPNPQRNLALGVVVGLFLGGLLAFAREGTDNVVRTSDDLKRQIPLPLLGILPLQGAKGLSFNQTRRDLALPPMLHPELAESQLIQTISSLSFREAVDIVTSNLQLRASGQTTKAITITSGLPGEGKTTVTIGLALSLARMGQRVLVIDADLRRSGLQAELGLSSENGLSNFLKGLPIATRPHRLDLGFTHLDILPAGPTPDDPIPLLSSPRFSQLLDKGREIYDVILIDTPPVLGMADAVQVGSVCDGTVLVTRLDTITQAELTETISLLAPLKVLGMIANGARTPSNRYVYDAPSPELGRAPVALRS